MGGRVSLRAWYKRHMGNEVEEWGDAAFGWRSEQNPNGVGTTVWSVFDAESKYFESSRAAFMINYRAIRREIGGV
jgi:hypothetical protein